MAIPVFSISIQINPDFAKFFNSADMAQIMAYYKNISAKYPEQFSLDQRYT